MLAMGWLSLVIFVLLSVVTREHVHYLLQSVGGSAWVVLSENRREAFTARTGLPVTAAEKLPLPAGQGEHEYYLLFVPGVLH